MTHTVTGPHGPANIWHIRNARGFTVHTTWTEAAAHEAAGRKAATGDFDAPMSCEQIETMTAAILEDRKVSKAQGWSND